MHSAFIAGAPFMALGHHDGRFVHAPGLFAFARRTPENRFLVLHLELCAALNHAAVPGHARWAWSLGQGMNTLLVHLPGQPAKMSADIPPGYETVLWHPDAQVTIGDDPCDVGGAPEAKVAERTETPPAVPGRIIAS